MARTADGCVLFCLIILIASLKLSKGVSFFIDEQDFGKVKQLSCGTGENFGTVTWLSKNVKDREWKPTSYEGNDVQLVPETSTLEVTITEDTLLGYQCRSDDTNETIITYWLLTQGTNGSYNNYIVRGMYIYVYNHAHILCIIYVSVFINCIYCNVIVNTCIIDFEGSRMT